MTDTTTTTTNTEQVPTGEKTSALDQLVGPGRKFQTPEDLAKGKLNADTFIESLTRENRELRTLVNQQDTRVSQLEAKVSILDRLDGSASTVTTPATTTTTTAVATTAPATGLSEDAALELIKRVKKDEVRAANKTEVDSVLFANFGDKAVAFVKQRAAELGISDAEVHNLALTSPKAFLSMLGVNKTNAQGNAMYVATGNGMTPPNPTAIRNQKYYDDLKTKMGPRKFVTDKAIQIQLHKDMQTLGDAYFS